MKTFREFMKNSAASYGVSLPHSPQESGNEASFGVFTRSEITQRDTSTLPATIKEKFVPLLPEIIRDSGGLEVTTEEVETKVLEVLQSDEFLTKLSDQLPKPTEVSSEEEFVDRASDVARRLLEDFFK